MARIAHAVRDESGGIDGRIPAEVLRVAIMAIIGAVGADLEF